MLQLVAKLLDVAQDAGGKVGPQNNLNPYYYYRYGHEPEPGLVRFVLDDFDKLEEEAYEKAIADARTRAERLARLSRSSSGRSSPSARSSCPATRSTTGRRRGRPRKRLEIVASSRRSRCGSSSWSGSRSDPKAERKGRTGHDEHPRR